MFTRRACIATLTTALTLSGAFAASAATRLDTSGATASPRPVQARTMAVTRAKVPGVVRPVRPTTTVVAITAFPTGDKGSGTEATCELWSDRLQFAEQVVDEATTVQDKVQAVNELNQDIDDALDAGCAVIYSAAPTSRLEKIKTVRLAAALRGGTLTTTWAPGPSVAYISAHPTGGKGSATEATCRLWTQALEEDQAIIDNAPDTDKQDAGELLERDIDNALDAGCFVIY